MDTTSTQQEILLVTGTSFSAGQCESKDSDEGKGLTERQRLEQACWNGLIGQMLPEICEKDAGTMFLWRIKEGASFIDLEYGESPATIEAESSIDPYAFLPLQYYS